MKNFADIIFISFFLLIGSFCASINSQRNCAETKFEMINIKINEKTYKVEKAISECQLKTGLSKRKEIKNIGMLFYLKNEDYQSFWMKDTLIPLSIAYINKDGIINEIIDMEIDNEKDIVRKIYNSKFKSKYALEVKKGYFEKEKIKIGDRILFN